MNEELYAIALKSALTEIHQVCEGVKWSFVLTKEGTIISGDDDKAFGSEATKAASSFKSLTEKAEAIEGINQLLIEAEKGKVHVSSINDNYLVTGTTRKADIAHIHSITSIVFPTIMRVLENIESIGKEAPTPLKPSQPKPLLEKPAEAEAKEKKPAKPAKEIEKPKKSKPLPSQQLIVDRMGGLLVRSDTVQVDAEILKRWSALLDVKKISEVEIETFGGRTAQCKVKTISDRKLEGRGLIRIPEKTCHLLEIKRGELVRVKPIVREK